MGKVTSIWGKTTGKVGALVYVVSGGETIVREYNPNIANPSTQAQVNQRAKMKLMSQLSASLAPVIAMTKDGLVSKRNKFTKYNFENCYAENGVAQITYENVQLTEGSVGLPTIVATRAIESGVTIQLAESAADSVSRVVYIMYRKTAEQKLQLVASVVANAAGDNGTFPATLPYVEGDIILYAYGMRDTNENASAKYGSLQVANAMDVARLTAVRKISSEDYQFTQTRGTTMYSGESEVADVPEGSARVYVTAVGGGVVSGAGVYEIGTQVQVAAITPVGLEFVGWRNNGSDTIISTQTIYTFTLEGMTDLIAVFRAETEVTRYTLEARPIQAASTAGAEVKIGEQQGSSISVQVNAGNSITVEAILPSGENWEFNGWRIQGQSGFASTSNPYTFTPNGNITLIADISQGTL